MPNTSQCSGDQRQTRSYCPGVSTCQIDDSVVTPVWRATTGPVLLKAAIEQAAERGAVQAVVVTRHLDQSKRDALKSCGLTMASEWQATSWPPKTLASYPGGRTPR